MTLLIDAAGLRAQAEAARGPLAPLAASLRAELDPLIGRGVDIPAEKALLSRDGGRCPLDGAALEFDPYDGERHRCPVCGHTYTGERHHRWWVMWRQLWLAERAVHAAALHAVTGEAALAALAAEILGGYADLYLEYPNRDNVLGPTRPFFSTYLESIWLLQLCVALDLLESAGAAAPGSRVRERIVEPSAALIASYDEGGSNRQVWNAAALLAAGRLLGRDALVRRAVAGPSGLIAQLDEGLLPDGSWYEGENYHFFAHRGLWYGVTLAERGGAELPADLVARFQEGFAAPLATALPDFTFPSRRDSQYAVSLRQWRFAESFELGLARADDERLRGALHELYERDVPRRDTGRWRSTAEAERNEPATSLSRADLGWRSLLLALPELPPLEPVAPRSALMAGQGIAVFRRDAGRAYVALDYGHSGGGHGHPDRLNLLIANGDRRILDDMGTGSYVDPSLHWYRSTLAHDAPLADGRSQERASGVLLAYDERGGAGWVDAEVPEGGIAPHVRVCRSVVVMPDYVVDRVAWDALRPVSLDLPFHVPARVEGVSDWRSAAPAGGDGKEDGFSFLRDTAVADAPAGAVVRLGARESTGAEAWVMSSDEAEWWRATAPGAPGRGDAPFVFARVRGRGGTLTTVWSWAGAVREVAGRDGAVIVRHADGTRHEHTRRGRSWHVELIAGEARSSIDLAGLATVVRRETPPPPIRSLVRATVPRLDGGASEPLRFELAEREYRRSELSWADAGCPSGVVTIGAEREMLRAAVRVRKSPLCFRAPDAPDPALDNEHPDIHSDGVQLYLQAPDWPAPAAWLAVPEQGSGRVRVRAVDGSRPGVPLEASWNPCPDGYEMRFAIPLSALGPGPERAFALDLIVNDMAPGRERRRGQLVLSGGAGEFIYLQGDRQSSARFLHFVVPGG
ncbi:MAG TPA: heparinase II/III family protein [Gemmatimonadaceae bacterium]|nr:heparinase II/III family protein [Gemmatimonadaceae bacterium]